MKLTEARKREKTKKKDKHSRSHSKQPSSGAELRAARSVPRGDGARRTERLPRKREKGEKRMRMEEVEE